jgi:hypothetical protein
MNVNDQSLIEYRCQRRDHQQTDQSSRASRVFVHRGSWAYCEAGKLAQGHEFLATGGQSRSQLERRADAGSAGELVP